MMTKHTPKAHPILNMLNSISSSSYTISTFLVCWHGWHGWQALAGRLEWLLVLERDWLVLERDWLVLERDWLLDDFEQGDCTPLIASAVDLLKLKNLKIFIKGRLVIMWLLFKILLFVYYGINVYMLKNTK